MVIVDVVVVLVVLTMRDAPSIERYAEGGMADVADDFIDQRIVRERAVAAVVSYYKEAPSPESDKVPPHEFPNKSMLKEALSEVVKSKYDSPVADCVIQRNGQGFVKAFLRNCRADVFQSERQVNRFFYRDHISIGFLAVFHSLCGAIVENDNFLLWCHGGLVSKGPREQIYILCRRLAKERLNKERVVMM